MNIKEAKEELIHTVRAYTAKDAQGNYKISGVRQRPVLLMGPPGIGKTAIMEQVAQICQAGLVAYTMTHHTRQSAVGLPMIQKQTFGGVEYAITEYTMSEIIASIYRVMETSGKKEGILFLDEINCVSETLAPTMLQFLQNKTFGSHRIPEGWVIVAAGNPAEYNKSVREFDVVTLDRVRRLSIEPDVSVWMEYALERGLHDTVLAYLKWKGENFYHIQKNAEGMEFVTARGWEDLSVLLEEYEELGIEVKEFTIREYLQTDVIAKDFFAFYQMYYGIHRRWKIDDILEGKAAKDNGEFFEILKNYPTDKKFCMTQLFLSRIRNELEQWYQRWKEEEKQKILFQSLELYVRQSQEKDPNVLLDQFWKRQCNSLQVQREVGILKDTQIREEESRIYIVESWKYLFGKKIPENWQNGKGLLEKEIQKQREQRDRMRRILEEKMERSVDFLERAFGEGAELIYFLTGVLRSIPGDEFLREKQPAFLEKQGELLLVDQEEENLKKILAQ